MNLRIIFNIALISLMLSSCSEKASPPLTGKRINVLHYDALKETKKTTTKISLSPIEHNNSWDISDAGQFTGLANNLALSKNLKFKQIVNLPKSNRNFNSFSSIINNILYQYVDGCLYAYNISSKKTLWMVDAVKNKEKKNIINGSLAYHNKVLYLSSGTREFIAFDSSNGKELWRFSDPNVVRNIPLIHENQIYISNIDNTISCLNLEGKLLWRYDAPIYSLAINRPYLPNIFYKDKIFIITTAGDLIVLNSYDGEEITQVNLATSGIIGDGGLTKGPSVSPLLNGDDLYVLTGEQEMIKIDLSSPAIAWRNSFPNAKSFWISGNTIFLLTSDEQLVAINSKEGEIAWVTQLPENAKKTRFFYGPMLAGSQLIINSNDGEFFIFNPYDGSLIAQHKNHNKSQQMPLVVNNTLYFVNNGSLELWN